MARNVKVDWRGVEEVAKGSEMAALVRGAADQIAANAEAQGVRVADGIPLPVKVYEGTTEGMRTFDRAVARVVLAHAAGLAVQAKHGTLTRAASSAGLTAKG